MKNQLFSLTAVVLFTLAACQPPVAEESESMDYTAAESESPDYAAFDKKVNILRAFLQAHCNEDLDAQIAMLADTLQWSPPAYNDNQWLGKEDYVAALKGYHDNFENIKFAEGIQLGDTTANGMWSGSVFPQASANNDPNAIRQYGTWSATHTESGKEIGVKWFAISWLNDAGQIVRITEFWDVNGLAVQIAAE